VRARQENLFAEIYRMLRQGAADKAAEAVLPMLEARRGNPARVSMRVPEGSSP
jgi:hypothetical protein